MTQRNRKTSRMLAACICLLAVLFAYAPLAGATWSAYVMGCCEGGMCTIPGHHHSKGATQSTGNDCNHSAGMTTCAMSCCQDSEKFGVTSLAFVLTRPTSLLVGNRIGRFTPVVRPVEIPRSIEPASPPPRTAIAVL
jgi:hypothetical protein